MTYIGVLVRVSKAISRFGVGRIIRIGRTGEAAEDPMVTGAFLWMPAAGIPSQSHRPFDFLSSIREATYAVAEHAAIESASRLPLIIVFFGNRFDDESLVVLK